jgi:peroxisomal membrane protein 2
MSQPSGILQVAWQRYLAQLNKRPLRTKALTAACIAGLSDVIAQRILVGRYRSPYRTLLCALYGLLWNGPSNHFWQKFMEKLFRGKTDNLTVIRKVLFDQVTYGPLCNLLFMSFATIVLEGKGLATLREKIRWEQE